MASNFPAFFEEWMGQVKWLLLGIRSQFVAWGQALPYLLGIGESRKQVTEQYPDPVSSRRPEDLPPRYRGVLFNNIDRCTGCGDCVSVCPFGAIKLQASDQEASIKKWVASYEVDLGRCVNCGLCVERCVPGSLHHTHEYEASAYRRRDLVLQFGRGARRD